VVLEQKLTGYISCEAASENDRKKFEPAIIYIYIKGKYNLNENLNVYIRV